MMKVNLLLLLVVAAVTVDNSEARVRDVVKGAVGWMRQHCSVGLSFPWGAKVSCTLNRRKKQAGRPDAATGSVLLTKFGSGVRGVSADANGGKDPDKDVINCATFYLPVNKITKLVLDEAFMDIDDDDDGVLNAYEFAEYQEVIQLLEDCINGNNKHGPR